MSEEEGCGVFSIDIPQDLFVLLECIPEYGGQPEKKVIGVFCNRDYAQLYGTWLKNLKKHRDSDFEIEQTRGNPPKETIENYV